jgi:hypothetical protein
MDQMDSYAASFGAAPTSAASAGSFGGGAALRNWLFASAGDSRQAASDHSTGRLFSQLSGDMAAYDGPSQAAARLARVCGVDRAALRKCVDDAAGSFHDRLGQLPPPPVAEVVAPEAFGK